MVQNTSARDMSTLHYNRARSAYRLGRHCAAIDDCNAALEKDASYRNAVAQRAECYMVVFVVSRRRGWCVFRHRCASGLVLQSLFDFDKACRDFQALVDADPSDKQWNRRLSDARSLRDMTHYQILGLPLEADAVAIKKAYRSLCLRWHPDKHTSSAEAQQRANTAFMVSEVFGFCKRLADNWLVHSASMKPMTSSLTPTSECCMIWKRGLQFWQRSQKVLTWTRSKNGSPRCESRPH